MPSPITAVLCGAGGRGLYAYGPYALQHPDDLRFVAVAEPNAERRERFANAHGIPPERRFASWDELFAAGRLADTCFNMTQDQMHLPSTLAALDAGYELLLEKPMASRLADSVALVQAAERGGRLMQICHVLRYTPFFSTLHAVLASGRLGQIVTVEHRENVVFWHMAHSFVRGSWGNLAASSPMLLAKCCHDLDILVWNMGAPVERLSSVGSLMHFRLEHAPPGATERCTDPCPAGPICPFDARRIYLNMDVTTWPVTALTDDLSYEGRLRALQTGPYGRCAYKCDNDVVDHQVVQLEFEGGVTASFTMVAFTTMRGRQTRIFGSHGELTTDSRTITVDDFRTLERRVIDTEPIGDGALASGHGGGDEGLVVAMLNAVRQGDQQLVSSGADQSLESHLMVFAAEQARRRGTVEPVVLHAG